MVIYEIFLILDVGTGGIVVIGFVGVIGSNIHIDYMMWE